MKAYRVRIEFEAVLGAESKTDAENVAVDLRDEICRDNFEPHVMATLLSENDSRLPFGWDPETLVYHKGCEDIAVADLLRQDPNAQQIL